MNENDHDRILNFYESSFAEYGDDPQSMHWADEEMQHLRFEKLVAIAPLNGKKILDVGCGLGDLYKFFLKNKIDVDYTGVDIVPVFIERARERFIDVNFTVGNAETICGDYDYIFASGTLSFTVENAKQYYFNIVRSLYERARLGVAFNLLDRSFHKQDDTYFSYDKEEVVAFCKTFAKEVVLVDGYHPWDFTIYLYKN